MRQIEHSWLTADQAERLREEAHRSHVEARIRQADRKATRRARLINRGGALVIGLGCAAIYIHLVLAG